MRRAFIALAVFVATSSLLWAPPYNPIELVSSAPSGTCTTTNVIKEYVNRSDGTVTRYGCVGGSWAVLTFTPASVELVTGNTATESYCLTYDSATAKFEWLLCSAASGSGVQTVQESDTTVSTTITTFDFGAGFDVTETPANEANIVLDYTEDPINLTSGSGEATGTLPVTQGGTGGTTAALARSNLGAAGSGANSDITSLTGLTTALAYNYGGTGNTTAQDENVLVGSGSAWVSRAIPNCPSGNQLLFTTSGGGAGAFSCEADGAVGGSGVEGSEEGVDQTAATRNRINFIGAAITLADDAGTPEIDVTLSQSPAGSTSVVGTGRTLTAGAGLSGTGDLSADRTLATASDEAGFVGTTNLTALCGASNSGKMSVQAPALQYCDGNATSVVRYVGLGDSSGNALTGDSGTGFFQSGRVDVLYGGTGATELGTSGDVLFNSGGVVGYALTGNFSYDDTTGGGTLTIGAVNTFGATDGTRGITLQDNISEPSAPSANTFLYSSGGELYKKDSGDSTNERLILNSGNVSGDLTFTAGVADLQNDSVDPNDIKVTGQTDEYCLTYEATGTTWEWAACASSSGDITDVGPGYASGGAFTDGVVSTGTTMLIWEGTSADANELNIISPSANPGADIDLTLPAATDTIVGRLSTDTFTNKTLNVESTGNVVTTVEKLWLPSAGCNNATAGSFWDLPTSNPAVAACVTGSNTQKATLDFADGANTLSAQQTLILPADFTGAIDARIKWFTAATAGDVVWQLATICVADAETDDPAFNAASTVTDTAKGTTLQTNDAAITGVTATGCAAGELLHVKVLRDPTTGADTLAATASLIGVELTIRRAQ